MLFSDESFSGEFYRLVVGSVVGEFRGVVDESWEIDDRFRSDSLGITCRRFRLRSEQPRVRNIRALIKASKVLSTFTVNVLGSLFVLL